MDTTDAPTTTPAITADEVDAINAARLALKAIASRNHGNPVHGSALCAGDALFSVLNHADAFLGLNLTDEQLHGVHRG